MKRLLTLAFCLFSANAWAACPGSMVAFTVKDGNTTTQQVCFGGAAGFYVPAHMLINASGTEIGSTLALESGNLAGILTAVQGVLPGTTYAGTKGGLVLASVLTAPPTYNSGNRDSLSLTIAGGLRSDVASVGGTAADTNSGTVSAGTLRVVLPTNQPAVAVTPPANQSVNIAQINGSTASVPAQGRIAGSYLMEQGCAGETVANTHVTPINNAGASTSIKLVSLVSAKNVYVCAINIMAAGANSVALVEGTKVSTECDTTPAGMAGGATAATGWPFAANGGLTLGNAQGVVFKTATVAHDVCLLFSAANQVSGSITWAQF